jgi:xanthine dehydrogenase YagS FAD-binding subunit
MKAFEFEVATTPHAAVDRVVRRPGGTYLAGGTNLVDLMRLGVARPDLLVDVTSALSTTVEETDSGSLLIGAGVRNGELAANSLVRRAYPVLSQALLAGASGQLRNMATVGGNLLQRTRCLYFQDTTKPCNKRVPGSGCPARTGIHRDLAIIGGSEHCIATHPSDMAVALAALDALVHVTGPDGDRSMRFDDFYRLPGDDPTRDTTLEHADLITAVELPAPTALSRRSMYRKARDRASYAFAVGAVAVALELDEGTVKDVRIALGAVAPRPWRAYAAEEALRGEPASADAFRGALDAELAAADPLPDNAFKLRLVANLGAAALTALTRSEQGQTR